MKKKCKKCDSEEFNKRNNCIRCLRIANKRYKDKNKEKIKQYEKIRYKKNKEHINKTSKDYYNKNIEKSSKRVLCAYYDNREENIKNQVSRYRKINNPSAEKSKLHGSYFTRWSDVEIDTMNNMIEDGIKIKEIAFELNRSCAAVSGKHETLKRNGYYDE